MCGVSSGVEWSVAQCSWYVVYVSTETGSQSGSCKNKCVCIALKIKHLNISRFKQLCTVETDGVEQML